MRLLACFLVVAISAFGQGNTSSIVGTVTDPSAAVVAGVKVIATNSATGVQTTSMTDSLGNYVINLLPPGSYQVDAEVSGFKKFVRQKIGLEMTRQLRIDIPLETGAVTETVSVTAETTEWRRQ